MAHTTVKPGGQCTLEMGYSPDAVKIENLDQGLNASILYVWLYNDKDLVATPEPAPELPTQINAGGGRTVQPPQKTGSSGPVNPATFVIYNEGPGEISVAKL